MVIKSRRQMQFLPLHDEIIGALPRPYWLEGGTLLDNLWAIKLGETDSESLMILDFNQPITPWPNMKSLTDFDFEKDLITIKKFIILALKQKPVGWVSSKDTLSVEFNHYIDFVRWRTDRGVLNNNSLSPVWFNEYDSSFKRSGREGLLKLESRVRSLLLAVKSNAIEIATDRRGDAAIGEIAKLLGVGSGASLTPNARNYLEQYFKSEGIPYTRYSRSRELPLLSEENVVSTAAAKRYAIWFQLWRLRSHLSHDPIGHRAFKTAREISEYCQKHFREPRRTPDAPAYQVSFLINSSLKILLDHVTLKLIDLVGHGVNKDGDLKNKDLLVECNKRLSSLGFPEISEYYHLRKGKTQNKATLRQLLFKILPMAARIITAAFSARRDNEITMSRMDCVSRDEAGQPWLNCRISKNLKRTQRIPIPESVVRAVEIVLKIRALGNRESQILYKFRCPITKRNVSFNTNRLMSVVDDYFQTPLLEDGTAWKFRPHQFRKLFGVTYFWRYAFPNLTALTYHYRHFNPETTRGYIELEAAEGLRMRDEKLAAAARERTGERKSDLESSRSAFVLWVLSGVAKGDKLDGALGKRITAQVEELKKRYLPELQITGGQTSSPSFDKALTALAKTTSLQVHPEGHSLCGWGSGSNEITSQRCASRCLELRRELTGVSSSEAMGPDFAYAEDTGCLVCPLRAALPTMAPRWESDVQEAELALAHSNVIQSEIVRERLELISTHRSDGYNAS
ncbi:hypothetical protein [Ochrobactrum sp. AN78]|uniref:hypothetical protein n=1 Tax=Ochrobactrum sp. AN78 TaxID=3039853 RepID=UPI002989BD93|nr:hypothetical protein [Ochrobactrum sp. AN78]MDH7790193.1 hypothetical protein [Ochrobactrum sp. AN78]